MKKCIITRGKPEVPCTVAVDGEIWWKTLAIMSPDSENRRGNPTHLHNRINYDIPYLPIPTKIQSKNLAKRTQKNSHEMFQKTL
jgi:hypothetical protein